VIRAAIAGAAFLAACSPSGGKAEDAPAAAPAVSPFPANSALVFPEGRGLELLNQCSRGAPEPVETTWTPTDADIVQLESRLLDYLRQQRPAMYPAGQPVDLIRHYAGLVMKGRRVIYLDAEIRGPGSLPVGEYPTLPDRPFNGVCDGGPAFFGVEYDVEAKTFSHLLENGPY
jgi:hypothetical protein